MYPVQDKEQLKEIPNIMSVMETSWPRLHIHF